MNENRELQAMASRPRGQSCTVPWKVTPVATQLRAADDPVMSWQHQLPPKSHSMQWTLGQCHWGSLQLIPAGPLWYSLQVSWHQVIALKYYRFPVAM